MSQSVDQREELDRLDLDEIKRFLRRRWKLIVATAFFCAILAAGICLSLTPTFKATAQVLLDPRRQHVFGSDQAGNDSSLDSSVVDSQIPIILSTRLLAKVIDKEHLAEDPEFASARQGILDRIAALFRPAKPVNIDAPSFDGIDPKLVPVISHLFDKIDVTRVQKSYVLSISVSAKTAAKATRLADTIAQVYVEDQVEVHSHALQQAADFFQDRLGSLRQQVHESEQAVADYRKAHGLTPVTDDRTTTVGQQQLQNLNEKLAQASADTAARLAAYQQATRFKAQGANLDSLPEIIRSPVINQLRTQQAELTRRAADLAAMYGPAFPAMAQIKAQRGGLDRAIASEMARLVSTSKNDYEVAKAREDSLRKSIASLSETSGGDDDVGVKLRELERINLANRALFENFLNRAKLTQEQSTFEETDARVISPALEPTSPSFPKTKIIVAVAFVVGLMLGLGLSMLLDKLRRAAPVKSTAARADAFILGRVPMIDGRRGGPADGVAEALRHLEAHPGSSFALAIAALADRIAPAVDAEGGRSLMISALGAEAGAASLAACLAAAAGTAGRRVLVIDADPVRRALTRQLGLDGRAGLAEVLNGEISANKVVAALPRFAMLPIGARKLEGKATAKQLRGFLVEARTRFDLVLINAPAFAEGKDPLALAASADGLAIVASWDQLLRDDFIAVVDAVADNPNFAGIVLNRVEADADELALAG